MRYLGWVLAFWLSSCIGLRHLAEDESLLVRQKIVYQANLDKPELKGLLKQRPNRHALLFPWLSLGALHAWGNARFDADAYKQKIAEAHRTYALKQEQKKSEAAKKRLSDRFQRKIATYERIRKEGNLWMRLGEPLAVYDSSLLRTDARALESHLITQGYLEGQVKVQLRTKGKKNHLTYTLAEGERYVLRSFEYALKDPSIRALIASHQSATYIHPPMPYTQEAIMQERDRLYKLLRNHGYFSLDRSAFFCVLDTQHTTHTLGARLHIEDTGQQNKPYALSSVSVSIAPESDELQQYMRYKNVQYVLPSRFKSWRLAPFIRLQTGTLYSEELQSQTFRQFQSLNLFRFIDISQDTLADGNLHARVQLRMLPRYDFSTEGGFTSYIPFGEGPQLPSPFFVASLKIRHAFRSLDVLNISSRFVLEALTTRPGQSPYQSFEAGLSFDLAFPHISLWRAQQRYVPRGQVQLGMDIVDRIDYNRLRVYQNYAINWGQSNGSFREWRLLDLSLISSDLTSSFLNQILDRFAENRRAILSSFENAFVSRTSFSLTHNQNYLNTRAQSGYHIRLYGEISGLTAPLYSALLEVYGLIHYRSVKGMVEYKHIAPISLRHRLVKRIKAGIIVPYGTNFSVPYESYFFSGGSSSMRAWRPRRIGPGSRPAYLSSLVERTGELALEGNIEWRTQWDKRIESAFFADAGNVWMITKKAALVDNDLFHLNRFYEEISLTLGAGMRFNFSFLLFRLDLGFKTYDPSQPKGQRFVLDDLSWRGVFSSNEQVLLNIGIGHPF